MIPDTQQQPTTAAGTAPAARGPGSRPSPRPRPAPPASEPESDAVSRGGEFGDSGESAKQPPEAPAELAEAGNSPNSPELSTTRRERVVGAGEALIGWAKGFFVPPAVLVERPAAWSELGDYAHRNARLVNAPGLVKALSKAWFYVITAPTVFRARFTEWVLVRPGRALLFIGVAELFLRTTPAGQWIGSVVRGFYAGLAWLLLP